MSLNLAGNNQVNFNGLIKGKGFKPHKTEVKDDAILLSQMTNNLRRVGIDRAPGVVDSDGSLVIQPGLNVKHNKKGDTITFVVGDTPKAEYIFKKSEKGETYPAMDQDYQTIFADAVKYIDKTIQKAKQKSSILADVDLSKARDIFSAVHKSIY